MNTRPLPLYFLAAAGATALAVRVVSRSRPMSLAGKVVLITGSSRGLGLALARGFAADGARLVICARDPDELEAARRDLAARGAEVVAIRCDVTDRAQVERLVESAVDAYGRLDIVVNNAGVIQVGPIHSMTIADFENAMDVMFWGVVYTTLAALPHLRKQRDARVVNITSIGGKISVPHLVPYSCAKFAAVAFSEGLRAELRRTGLKVVTIAPGLMRTGSHLSARFKGDRDAEAAWFSVSASFPGVSMSAGRAARQIIAAARSGRSERILTTQANLAARIHGLFPEAASEILAWVNRLLPGDGSMESVRGAEIAALRKGWLRGLTILGRRAAETYLQPGARQGRQALSPADVG